MSQKKVEWSKQMKKYVKKSLDDQNCYVRTEERCFYVEIDGKVIWVTEEFYRSYTRLNNRERRRRYDEGRCLIPAERGIFKRCSGNCSECPHGRTGYALSLDQHYEEYGYEAVDPYDLVADLKYQEKKDRLDAELSLLSELDRRIMHLHLQELTEREIGVEVGLSQKAVNLRINKCIKLMKERIKVA